MAVIRPFQALRPDKKYASEIAALPYDVYTREEARQAVKEEPDSFLKIDRAETQLEPGIDIYSEQVYEKARMTLMEMEENGRYIKDDKKYLYLYELTMNGRVQTGLGCCVSVEEYESGLIKKHENTRVDKEDDRTRHIEACSAQTGPVFLAYRHHEGIEIVIEEQKKEMPEYDFISRDGVGHKIWVIRDEKVIEKLICMFEEVNALYIADGHHRAASAARVARMHRNNDSGDQKDESQYFLGVLFPDRELMIMDYNRVIKDLNGYDKEDFLKEIQKKFSCREIPEAVHPGEKGSFSMYLDHQWYLLKADKIKEKEDVIDNLDVSILQDEVLYPILGITEPRTDTRITFIGGIRGLGELQQKVDREGGVAFAMYPTSMHELFAVADENRLMPPKSTWFEPKLRSGLLIHQI